MYSFYRISNGGSKKLIFVFKYDQILKKTIKLQNQI